MTAPTDPTALDACGCCEAESGALPIHDNRPGLPSLSYRLGTHGTFLRRLRTRLAEKAWAPLGELTTRAPDDLTMALLDACATTADVLTFYQEYLANEGFLRTATELRSVLELSRTIGYEPSPGVAARAWLAFSVEDPPQQMAPPGTPGAFPTPTRATIPKGTKVQSVPLHAGEVPQTFETVEAIEGRSEWNRMRPRTTRRQVLTVEGGVLHAVVSTSGAPVPVNRLYLKGAATNLRPHDLLVVVVDDSAKVPHDPFSQRVHTGVVALFVDRVTSDPLAQTTRVDLLVSNADADPVPFTPPVLPTGTIDPTPRKLTRDEIHGIRDRAWDEQSLAALIAIQRWDEARLAGEMGQVVAGAGAAAKVFVLRQRVAFFGHNGQMPRLTDRELASRVVARSTSATRPAKPGASSPKAAVPAVTDIESAAAIVIFRIPTIWKNEAGQTYGSNARYLGLHVFFERSVPEIQAGSWVVFQRGATLAPLRVAAVADATLSEFGVTGKATGLALHEPLTTTPPNPGAGGYGSLDLRSTTAYVQSDPLSTGELPIDPVIVEGGSSVMLDRMVLGLAVGQQVSFTGEGVDEDGAPNGRVNSEVLELAGITHAGGFTTLSFTGRLSQSYARATVTLNANVARATHGDTTPNEILGSGDATQPRQRWQLSRKPLTYVITPGAARPTSTLTVRVEGVAWKEVPMLYGQPAGARVYALRHEDDGATTVTFGSRLPTGTTNVTASYRAGAGPAGEVSAGTLAILQSRPLGVRGVTNPLPATGSQAAESLDEAREHAGRSTLTFDRIVSLDDYEDFVSASPGIGKAQAVAIWSGHERIVHITVGASTGGAVDEEGRRLLLSAIRAQGDPTQPVQIDSYTPRQFRVDVALRVDPAYELEAIKRAARLAMGDAFRFERRRFGQTATEAELLSILQAIPGIVAVTLSGFADPARASSDPRDVLPALAAHWDPSLGRPVPAELLLLDPLGLTMNGAYAP